MFQTRRLFVAIDLPQDVLSYLVKIQEQCIEQGLFDGSFPKIENIHLTLVFIGYVPQLDVVRIEAALDNVKAVVMRAQLGRLGLFMHGTHIKILYVDAICPGLHTLVADIQQVLSPWVTHEKQDFVSHITLARVKHIDDRPRLLEFVEKFEVNPFIFTIDSFALKESILNSDGVKHRDVVKYELQL